MPEDTKKAEEKKEITLSPEIGKYLDEWTANPQSKVFVKLAEEYRKSGLIEEALHVCEKGLSENPKYLSGNMVLAKIYFDMGEYDKSLDEAKKVSTVQTDNLMAQNLMLELYIKKGDKDNAINICDIISYLDPKNDEVINKKRELEEKGIVAPADPIVSDDDEPEEVEALMKEEFMGGAAAGADAADAERDEADESVAEQPVVMHKPRDEFTTNTVAELYIKQGYYEKGLSIYKELLTESPDEPKLAEKINEIEKLIEERGSDEEAVEGQAEAEPKVYEIEEDNTVLKFAKEDDDMGEDANETTADPSNEKTISRLESWLGKIQKRGRR